MEKDARHPFVVKADPVEVEVLGTHFNVEAYPGDAEVKTTLLEGSVAVNAPGCFQPGLRFLPEKARFIIEQIKHYRKKKQKKIIRLPVGATAIFILIICRCRRLHESCRMLFM